MKNEKDLVFGVLVGAARNQERDPQREREEDDGVVVTAKRRAPRPARSWGTGLLTTALGAGRGCGASEIS
jgi:hypothetical protein